MGGEPQRHGDIKGLHGHHGEEQGCRQKRRFQHGQRDRRQGRKASTSAYDTLFLPTGVKGSKRDGDEKIGVRGQRKTVDDDHAPKREDIELQKSQPKIGEGDIDELVVWSPSWIHAMA